MDFQDHFIAIDFDNISPTVLKKRSTILSFWERRKLPQKLCSVLAKVRALYYQAKIFTKLLSLLTERRHYKKNICYKNLSQFNEAFNLN